MAKKIATLLLLLLLSSIFSLAQKPALDHSVYDRWQSLSASQMSADGRVISYEVNPQEGDGTLYIRTFSKKAREWALPRGYRARISEDGTHVICLIKAPFAETRQARIRKKKGDDLPPDSLAIIDLIRGEIRKFPAIKSFKMPSRASDAVAFLSRDTSLIARKERKAKDLGYPLLIYHLGDRRIDTLQHIEDYIFAPHGEQLALIRKTDKKHSEIGFYNLRAGEPHFLGDTARFHSIPAFSYDGGRALYLQAQDSLSSGSKHCELYLYDIGKCQREQLSVSGIPEGWGLTENSSYHFSRSGERIFTSVQAFQAPKDTTLVPFETPGLDIWNWDADVLPPMGKKTLSRDLKRCYTLLYRPEASVLYSRNPQERLSVSDRYDGSYFLLTETVHPVETQWNMQNTVRLILVDAESGERREIACGALESGRLSPLGKFVIWWDYADLQWHFYDTEKDRQGLLAAAIEEALWDEEDDHPMRPEPYGIADWLASDSAVLLYDRYDIWKVPMDGSAPVRLTQGREIRRTYRYLNQRDTETQLALPSDSRILLSVFDERSKENGLASVHLQQGEKSFRTEVFGPWRFSSVQKAREAEVYSFQKGNFTTPPDLYRSESLGKKDLRLSAINPQQKDYNWGTVELYHWRAYDGTALDGLLYKPEDFDPDKKYPVMIYFYEKNSETLYYSYSPAPSASIINIPFYVSRGYVVFVPDIVYTSGLPGESAYNCIVSGAESLGAYPWIDRENMAIQGQSWGGYQVAYLVTRTSIFKAAGAGAPVANMTSAYGGIRWASGMSRQFQYEQTQSRIGRDLWNGMERYLENSPVFKLPNVTTPLLIMHNDNDGAVPWYQGIEMFMGLRRLGKPCWLLEYNGEEHNLMERRNRKDLSIRLQQFFDHYLKGEPAPAWMTQGVPTSRKGEYFGYELP